MKRVCVFCGSSRGVKPEFEEAAIAMGKELVAQNIGLVYGGGQVGLMGVIADTVLAEGGEVIGIIPHFLHTKEVAHPGLKDLRVVQSMHERKALMAKLSDGFLAMPGGFGTFEEICEVITWGQLGLHQKPTGILNVSEYYTPLLQLFDQGVTEEFIRDQHRKIVLESNDPADLLARMRHFKPLPSPKWIQTPSET